MAPLVWTIPPLYQKPVARLTKEIYEITRTTAEVLFRGDENNEVG